MKVEPIARTLEEEHGKITTEIKRRGNRQTRSETREVCKVTRTHPSSTTDTGARTVRDGTAEDARHGRTYRHIDVQTGLIIEGGSGIRPLVSMMAVLYAPYFATKPS